MRSVFVTPTRDYVKGERWKVTARFALQTSEGVTLGCVRVRSPGGRVVYLSHAEFVRLFRTVKTKEGFETRMRKGL